MHRSLRPLSFGVAVFGAVPDLWTLLGITMIIAAGAYVVHSQDAHR
jgi:drug/metabolite transporter (DMT)-like permease